MQPIENLVKTTMAEMERILDTKTVIGDPMTFGEIIVVPLISIGLGFGAGGGSGSGQAKEKSEGYGGGTGGGMGIRPVALIVIDKQGVRIEPVVGPKAGMIGKIAEAIPQVMERMGKKKEAPPAA